ncbi:unnamed protein product, partial [Prorocentrum cordatum]
RPRRTGSGLSGRPLVLDGAEGLARGPPCATRGPDAQVSSVRRSPGPAANAQMSALCGRRPPHAVDLEGGADTLYARSAMSPERAHAPAAPAAGPSLTVVGASGLRAADSNGSSDPYCTCKLQGDNHRLFKTNIVRRSLNPTWNFFYALPDSTRGRVLKFEVWDHDAFTKDDFLGTASLLVSRNPCDASREFPLELRLVGESYMGNIAEGSLKLILRGLLPSDEAGPTGSVGGGCDDTRFAFGDVFRGFEELDEDQA